MSCRGHKLFDKKWNALLRKKGSFFMLMWYRAFLYTLLSREAAIEKVEAEAKVEAR